MNATTKRFAGTALGTIELAGALWAQQTASQADAHNSDAHIFLSSSKQPQRQVNIGVTRAVGTVRNGVGDASTLDFTMFRANGATANGAQRADATVISFHSQNVERLSGESYRASGVLTVTFVERVEMYDPNEGNSGPPYGPSKTYSVKHEVTFEFRPTRQGTARGGTAYTDWLASTLMTGQSFPELLLAVSNRAWPDYIVGDACSAPTTFGGDFSDEFARGLHCRRQQSGTSAKSRAVIPSRITLSLSIRCRS
jgi:hypothetical protein